MSRVKTEWFLLVFNGNASFGGHVWNGMGEW